MPEAIDSPATEHARSTRSWPRLALEVLMIGLGVFLGLVAQEWHETNQRRDAARESLQRFRAEIDSNGKAIKSVLEYHKTLQKRIDQFLSADEKSRAKMGVQMQGIQPVAFEHTAWDLALATQSLSYIDPKLGFSIARIYNVQQTYSSHTNGVLQSMYVHPPNKDPESFFAALEIYFGDVVIAEPGLLRMYAAITPQIDSALGNTAGRTIP